MLTGQSSHPCSTIKRISIIMAMFGTLDVLLQFRNFRNIDLYHQGVYYLRAQVSVPEERQRRRKQRRAFLLPSSDCVIFIGSDFGSDFRSDFFGSDF